MVDDNKLNCLGKWRERDHHCVGLCNLHHFIHFSQVNQHHHWTFCVKASQKYFAGMQTSRPVCNYSGKREAMQRQLHKNERRSPKCRPRLKHWTFWLSTFLKQHLLNNHIFEFSLCLLHAPGSPSQAAYTSPQHDRYYITYALHTQVLSMIVIIWHTPISFVQH